MPRAAMLCHVFGRHVSTVGISCAKSNSCIFFLFKWQLLLSGLAVRAVCRWSSWTSEYSLSRCYVIVITEYTKRWRGLKQLRSTFSTKGCCKVKKNPKYSNNIWKWVARPQTARARVSNSVSGEQCHLIHLTILWRFSWPSLAYMCTKVA